MKTVITYGTFDCFHYGHYNLLKRAKALGDRLIVGVSSDKMCRSKGKIPFFDEEYRRQIVSDLVFVDEVILEESMEQKVEDARRFGANVFVLGGDYRDVFPKMKEYPELLNLGCEVVFLDRTPDISSSDIKKKLAEEEVLKNS
ncbi:MAG: adenylyltransferase/cytidyltransferase family protein [Candidatus Enteromonas sp.]